MLALGIMNGTSLDGIDYSLIEANAQLKKIQFKKHKTMDIPSLLKKKLIACANNQTSTYEVSLLHFELGQLYAKQVKKLKNQWRFDIIGLHGQTVHHEGKKATLQIGHPAPLSLLTGKPVYYDFRSGDVACGGQGAPFAPFFQSHLLKNAKKDSVAFHNLGGISNLTLFHKGKVIAFDTGPANRLLDEWILKKKKLSYDKNGTLASRGLPDPLCVRDFLMHSYFTKRFPKSTGRELFNLDYILRFGGKRFLALTLADQLATLTELTAKSLQMAYQQLPKMPEEIYFYGGGVNNPYLMERIQFHLPNICLSTTQDWGWPEQAFESSMVAFLALARHLNIKVHRPEVTGAQKRVGLGAVYHS